MTEIAIPEQHHEFLASQGMGILTTLRKDGVLSSNPVAYLWNGECIRISTLKSRLKYKSLAADERVAFCVWNFQNPMQYLEIRGTASLEDDPDKHFFIEQFKAGMGGQEPPADMDPPEAERAIIRLHPSKVSSPTLYGGRFDRD